MGKKRGNSAKQSKATWPQLFGDQSKGNACPRGAIIACLWTDCSQCTKVRETWLRLRHLRSVQSPFPHIFIRKQNAMTALEKSSSSSKMSAVLQNSLCARQNAVLGHNLIVTRHFMWPRQWALAYRPGTWNKPWIWAWGLWESSHMRISALLEKRGRKGQKAVYSKDI